VRFIAASYQCCFTVTQSGEMFQWGRAHLHRAQSSLRPVIVEGFVGVVCVRCVLDWM
jgi:hypothetical protein